MKNSMAPVGMRRTKTAFKFRVAYLVYQLLVFYPLEVNLTGCKQSGLDNLFVTALVQVCWS